MNKLDNMMVVWIDGQGAGGRLRRRAAPRPARLRLHKVTFLDVEMAIESGP
jgi:hypothetical protein